MVMVILYLLPVLLLFIIFAAVIYVRNKHDEEGEEGAMMLKNLYVYLVLFATLMMSIGGSVAAFMAIADIVTPQTYYQSYESYKLDQQRMVEKTDQPTLTEEQMKSNYDRLVADEKARARERALNSLVKSLGWVVIPLPIFLYFQRSLRKRA